MQRSRGEARYHGVFEWASGSEVMPLRVNWKRAFNLPNELLPYCWTVSEIF
mgnify:CR=1 FL=1